MEMQFLFMKRFRDESF